jgi:4'-phosphopantetheinyl transferase
MASSPPGRWDVPPDELTLALGEVHVWRIPLQTASSQAQKLDGLLAGDEAEKAGRFHFQRDRDRYVTVRGILRVLLGRYLHVPPHEITFQYSVYGKPALAPSNQTNPLLNFNVSHSHELALLAFTHNPDVGVDLEYFKPQVVGEKLAEQYFSAQESAALRALPLHLQMQGFFNCWTRKEAFIKAIGEGLSHPLDGFSVSLAPGEPARLLEIRGESQGPANWLIHELDVGPGYAAALAVQKPIKRVYCWEFPLA